MGRPSANDRPSPSHAVYQSRRLPFFGVLRDARQTPVKSICIQLTREGPPTETGRRRYVMESLPLTLHNVLLGCVLSRYLWEVDVIVAGTTPGVTALGVIFPALSVVAGTVSTGFSSKTPDAHILYYIIYRILPHKLRTIPHIRRRFCSVYPDLTNRSQCIRQFLLGKLPDREVALFECILSLPFLFAYDAYRLFRAVARTLITLSRGTHS